MSVPGVFDLEAENWDQALSADAIAPDGECTYFKGRTSHREMANYVYRRGGTWCAHYGGGYDIPLLLNYLPNPDEVVMIGSKILSVRIGKLTMRDTFPAWQMSLAKVGEAVGLPKLEYDRQQLQILTPEELEAYNRRDNEILRLAITKHQEYLTDIGAKNAWTSGSAAVNILQALEPGTWSELNHHRLDVDVAIAALSCIRGGRVECFYRGHIDGVQAYDVKSSYPARYATENLGIGCIEVESRDASKEVTNPNAILFCSWFWKSREEIAPALDEMTAAGYGQCEAWLCFEERQMLLESRTCRLFKAHYGWKAKKEIPFGQEFARELYAQKEAGNPWGKTFINSLHGKLGESPIKETFTAKLPSMWYGKEHGIQPDYVEAIDMFRYDILDCNAQGLVNPTIQPIAGAQVLGRARAAITAIWRADQAAGGQPLYGDTDSEHTTTKPENMPVPLGKKLGQLAHEGGPYRGVYLGPKAYYLEGAPKVDPKTGKSKEDLKMALKGVPAKGLKNAYWDGSAKVPHFREIRSEEKSNGVVGYDARYEVFDRALNGGVKVAKGGITSFVSGSRKGEWHAQTIIRNITTCGRGKGYDENGQFFYLTREGK